MITWEEIEEKNYNFWVKYHAKKYWYIFGFEIKKLSHVPWCHRCNDFDHDRIVSKIKLRKIKMAKKKQKKQGLRAKLDRLCDKVDAGLKYANLLRQALKLFDLCREKLAALLAFLKEKVKK